jgi:hypothetical protein
MAGFGLVHLGFLAAASALAVPVLVHLLLRPRARRVEIGTVRFLRLVLRESTRRRKLRHWLLLALRCAAIVLLALLFARPYWGMAGEKGRQREVILLIDQSASMGAVQTGQTLFARAQEAADKVLQELPEHTAVQLAYFDAQGVEPAPEVRIDPTRQAGYAASGYDQAMRWARDRIVLSSRNRRMVYFFTNLQRGQRSSSFDSMPPEVDFEVVEVGPTLLRNLGVVRAETSGTTIRDKQPVVVNVQVRNAGLFAARDVRVRLVLEGASPKREETQTVSVPADSVQEIRFLVRVERPGIYTGFVEVVADDDFPLDNRRWLAFEARPPDRLLLVDGEPGRTVYTNETYFLEAALRLRLPGKDAPLTPYEPERLPWEAGARLAGLDRYRAVVLCNVDRLAEADRSNLVTFVSGGGSLLVFTGGRVQARDYEPLCRSGLLPAAVEGPAGPDVFRFGTWDTEHPLLRPLSDPQRGDLRRITFRHITRLKPTEGAKVLARAQGGEPLLVEGRLREGTVLLVASAADRDWSDWPQSRLYVPLVHQIVGYLTGRLVENGAVRTAPTGPGRQNPPGIVPDGRTMVVHNLDPTTSEIKRLSEEAFRTAYNLRRTEKGHPQTVTAASPLPGDERAGELWAYVVWALLVVLGIEFVIANRTHA